MLWDCTHHSPLGSHALNKRMPSILFKAARQMGQFRPANRHWSVPCFFPSSAPDMLGPYWKEWNTKSFMVHRCYLCFRKQITLNSLNRVSKRVFFLPKVPSWIILYRCFDYGPQLSKISRVPVAQHDPSLRLLRVRLAWDLKITVEQRINAGISERLKLQSDLKETISKCQLKSNNALLQSAY